MQVKDRVISAKVAISSVGLYELRMNEQKVGNRVLTPGFTSYNKRGIQYQEYEITDYLLQDNTICITVAPGWAVGYIGYAGNACIYADHVSACAKFVVTYQDGSEEVFFTDPSWEVYTDEVTFADIYHGETIDKTHIPTFLGMAKADDVPYRVIPDIGEAICEHEVLKAVLLTTPKGEKVLDFGQNMTGYVSLAIRGQRGSKVKLSFGEVLDQDGNFYNENYRTSRNEITYILSGEDDFFKPRFSFQGFRFVRIDEYPYEEIDVAAFSAIVVHSDIKRIGNFTCGNEKINQLYHNIIWGQKSNYLDIPTDCPQRDERLGWTGDAQVFCRTAGINYDVRKFFDKWLADLRAEQADTGEIYGTCPEGPGMSTRAHTRTFAAWADAGTIIPWTLYQLYGDKTILSENFDMMCRWVDYMHAAGEEEFLWLGGWHYGDWLALDAGEDSYQGITSTDLIASAFFAYSTQLVIRAGQVLGKDVSAYQALYHNILAAFRKTYLESILSCDLDITKTVDHLGGKVTQTAMVLILQFDLCKEEEKAIIVDRLVKLIDYFGGKMATGFVGTPYILHTLSGNGRVDVAYDLLFREDPPSWLYSVNMGATTMWEHWNGIKEDGTFWSADMNSFNHYAYGAIGDWLYGVVAGIKITEPGYKMVTLSPQPDQRLGYVTASVKTPYGELISSWEYGNETVKYQFTIPEGITAHIILPNGHSRTVSGGGCICLHDAV
jgi:alpha-L-rhamnosidase